MGGRINAGGAPDALKRRAGDALRRRAQKLAASLPKAGADLRAGTGTRAGFYRRRSAGRSDSFRQLRPYRSGDPPAGVDWRQSARREQLVVREHEQRAAPPSFLWCDDSPSMLFASTPSLASKYQRAALLAMAFAFLLRAQGERPEALNAATARARYRGLASPGGAWARLCNALVKEEMLTGHGGGGGGGGARKSHGADEEDGAAGGAAFSLPAGAPQRGRVFMAGDFFMPPPQLAAFLARRADAGGSLLLVVHDPAESGFPYDGRTLFLGAEGEGRILVEDAAAMGDAYRAAYRSWAEALRRMAAAHGVGLLFHDTASSPLAALAALRAAWLGGAA